MHLIEAHCNTNTLHELKLNCVYTSTLKLKVRRYTMNVLALLEESV